jgi:alpha-tubulin suppressor-like RCC1 family protein
MDNVNVVFPPTNPPVIITQPAGLAVQQGSNATFSVAIDGTPPFRYQWQFNGTNISGATTSGYSKSNSYTRTNVQPAMLGNYSVFISNGAGSVLSSNAALAFLLPPSLSGPTNLVVGIGLNATFAVTATGTLPLAYQWEFNGANLAGATTSSLTISNAQVGNGGTYAVVVTNLYGTASSSALLIVQDPFIVGQPQPQAVAAGALASSFGVSAVGTLPLSYQWLKGGLPLVNGGNISGAQTSSLTVSNVQAADMANYSVVVSNINGWVVSSSAALIGPFPPVIVTQPVGQKLLAASAASFTVEALGLGQLTFQWQQNGTNLADVGKFAGSATPSLSVSNVQAGEMGNYSVAISNTYGPVVSGNALLSLWPLVSWGNDAYGQTEVPGGLTNVVGISEGIFHSLALKGDGTVVAWGAGTTYTKNIPHYGQSAVPADLSNVVGVAGGYYHSLALEADGTVVAWGAGLTNAGTLPNYGQALVPAALSNVVGLAGGFYHSLALKADRTVVAWGAGTTNTGLNPDYGQALIPAGLSGVVGIAAGAYHSLALKADGTVTAWGAGMTNTDLSPDYGQAMVPAGLSNVVAIAAGGYHSLALKADGTVVAWGAGTNNVGSNPNYGQALVPAGLSNVVAIAAGHFHSLALEADGTVVVWGAGTNNTGVSPSFGQAIVPVGLGNVIMLGGRGYHVLVLEGDGRPQLTVQPLSRMLAVGGAVSFTAMAVGGQPLIYQWQRNGTNLTDNARITGSHENALTIANLSASDAGNYQAVITNNYGSAASAVAALTTSGPVFEAVTVSGGTITLTWTATAGSTYQPQYKTNLTQTNWTNLGAPISATNNIVTASDVAPADRYRFYRVVLMH